MPNRDVHRPVSAAAGTAWALLQAEKAEPLHVCLEGFGGYLGGLAGAALPDVIDPPTSPHHRGVGHGVLSVGAAIRYGYQPMQDLVVSLRAKGRELAEDDSDPWKDIGAAICFIGAGFLNGALAGYVAHLAMDSGTKFGLPLVCQKL